MNAFDYMTAVLTPPNKQSRRQANNGRYYARHKWKWFVEETVKKMLARHKDKACN